MPGHPKEPNPTPAPVVPESKKEKDTAEQVKPKQPEKVVPEKNDEEEKFHRH